MAVALAATIKANNPDIPVAVIVDGKTHFREDAEKALFSHIINAPEESYTNKKSGQKTEFIKIKTWIYELSPFDQTIFLDVDIAILTGRDLKKTFAQLQGKEFVMTHPGHFETDKSVPSSFWADGAEVLKAYNLKGKKWPNYHSEFIYFKKCKAVKKYFDTVRKVFESPKVKCLNFAGATMADELAFMIASMQLDYYSQISPYMVIFWHKREVDKRLRTYQIEEPFIGYSMGGAQNTTYAVENYNILVGAAFFKLKLRYPYKYVPKSIFLKERTTI